MNDATLPVVDTGPGPDTPASSVTRAEARPLAPAAMPDQHALRSRGTLRRIGHVMTQPFVLLRFLLRRVLWLIVRLLRGAWRHPIASLLVILALGLSYQGYDRYVREKPDPPPTVDYEIATAIPPPGVAIPFLQAQREFDGGRIWDLLDPATQANFLAQGMTRQVYVQQMSNLRSNGVGFGESTYIGGVEGPNDINTYFYVTVLPLASGQTTDIYQVLYVSRQTGKLLGWENPIPDELLSSSGQ